MGKVPPSGEDSRIDLATGRDKAGGRASTIGLSLESFSYCPPVAKTSGFMLLFDGSQGEGGGQILRTCLSMSALTRRPFRLINIRAKRSRPGLRPQHLTAVRAVATICSAELNGATLDSQILDFKPQTQPRGGTYIFDVSDAARTGSAGSVTLILQAILWPLLFADAPSRVTLRGGTHVPYSPPYHYLAQIAQPTFARLGAPFSLELKAWGWYPQGGGEVVAVIEPIQSLQAASFSEKTRDDIYGVAAVTNLPAHIPQRMARRAHNLLADLGLRPEIMAIRERGVGPGAGIFLWTTHAGFSSLGRQGLRAEKVAEMAVAECRAFIDNKAGVDKNLADQLLLPCVLAGGRSSFTTSELTKHTFTNAQLLSQWFNSSIEISGEIGLPGVVRITGIAFTR